MIVIKIDPNTMPKKFQDHLEAFVSLHEDGRLRGCIGRFELDDVVVGKHGIYIEYGPYNGTYLPQVATDMKWDAQEFVRSCCVEKAGIQPEHCKDATLYVYEAIIF